MGGLAYGLVKRILYRGSSLKFTAFFSSDSRYINVSSMKLYSRGFHLQQSADFPFQSPAARVNIVNSSEISLTRTSPPNWKAGTPSR